MLTNYEIRYTKSTKENERFCFKKGKGILYLRKETTEPDALDVAAHEASHFLNNKDKKFNYFLIKSMEYIFFMAILASYLLIKILIICGLIPNIIEVYFSYAFFFCPLIYFVYYYYDECKAETRALKEIIQVNEITADVELMEEIKKRNSERLKTIKRNCIFMAVVFLPLLYCLIKFVVPSAIHNIINMFETIKNMMY